MEDQKGRVGIAVLVAILLASAAVSWAVSAMADDDSPVASTGTSTAPPAAEEEVDLTDPENAEEFDGPKHQTYDASIDAPLKGTTHDVNLEVTEETFEVDKGKFMHLWTFGGKVPGPVIRVTQGDTINFKLTNNGTTAHSMDFHAAEIAPNRAYIDVQAGESFEFEWEAVQPGVYMYHCATPPVLHHIGNGMYGMVIVEPRGQQRPAAREYALVQSELYFGGQDKVGDLGKMTEEDADWIVFNGHANQYVEDPLTAEPGELVRVYILNAGPSKWSAFHVIGTIFDWTWQEGVVGGPSQTVNIAPSQGAIVEFTMEEDGMYPFVTHAFGDAVKGAIGMFKAGDGGPEAGGGH